MSHAAQAHSEEYGAHGHKDHGHVIVSLWTLRLVLIALLFFTLLTVGAAQLEELIATLFHVNIPNWMNAGVALSIAVVKTSLVVLFFMQLKYDNPLNGMIFIFTVMTVAFFLGFTTLDLGNRQTIDRFKGRYIVPGGTGLGGNFLPDAPITKSALETAKANGDFDKEHLEHAEEPFSHTDRGSITDAGFKPTEPTVGSSADKARPVKGITLPGFAPAQPEGERDAKPVETPAKPAAAGDGKK